jgi:hypothetical protein
MVALNHVPYHWYHYCELVHYVQGAYGLTWQVAIKMSHFEVLHGFD